MAVLMVLGLIRRQGLAVAAGLALTCFALVLVTKAPGVYYAQVNVRLLLRQEVWYINPIQNASSRLISTAGLLQRTVIIGHGAQPVSDNTTLFGIGERHGDAVRVPNTGGQWAYNFEQPVLNVETTGSTPEEALSRMNTTLAKVKGTLASMQNQYDVPARQQIITALSPPVPQVRQVVGSPVRAKAITVLLGTFLTLLGAGLLDLNRSARRRRRDEAQAAADDQAFDENTDEPDASDEPDESDESDESEEADQPDQAEPVAVPRQKVHS